MGIPTDERDRRKCLLYDQIYQSNRNRTEYINPQGNPTVRYWQEAGKIVERKMREWEDGKDPFRNEKSFILPRM
ncbi:MAG: hypothetical protein ABH864_02825 [archaeon]